MKNLNQLFHASASQAFCLVSSSDIQCRTSLNDHAASPTEPPLLKDSNCQFAFHRLRQAWRLNVFLRVLMISLAPGGFFAQQIILDHDFGSQGAGFESLPPGPEHYEIAIKPDGGILVGFVEDLKNDRGGIGISALNADGQPDTTFGINGRALYTPIEFDNISTFKNIKVLPSGKILLGALVDIPPEEDTYYLLMRLLPDGTPDSSFQNAGHKLFGPSEADFIPLSLDADQMGRCYMIGINDLEGVTHGKVALQRLLDNGEPDPVFGTAGLVITPGYPNTSWMNWGGEIRIMPDGKILTTALASFSFNVRGYVVARYLESGVLDTTFADHGRQLLTADLDFGSFLSIHPQPDGSVIYMDYDSYFENQRLYKLGPHGEVIESFGDNGFVFLDSISSATSRQSLVSVPDGSLLLLTTSYLNNQYVGQIARYDQDFIRDLTFGDSGHVVFTSGEAFFQLWGGQFQDDEQFLINAISRQSQSLAYNRIYRFKWTTSTSSITPVQPEVSIRIYPNPVHTSFYLDSPIPLPESTVIDLWTAGGHLVQSWNYLVNHDFPIKTGLPSGMYVLRVQGPHRIESQIIFLSGT